MARGDLRFVNHGAKELMVRMVGLERKIRRSIATKVLRAGAKIVVKAIRDAAPKASGKGAKALGTKIKTYRGSQITVAISGERFDRGRGDDKKPKNKWGAPHFHLIEYGTGERFHTGEKAARRVAREAAGLVSPEMLGRLIRDARSATGSGTFGNVERWKFNRRGRVQFSRNIRDTQAKIKLGNALVKRLARRSAIAKAIRSGHPTGRVIARPFFQRAVRGAISAVQAKQREVLGREIEAAWAAAA